MMKALAILATIMIAIGAFNAVSYWSAEPTTPVLNEKGE